MENRVKKSWAYLVPFHFNLPIGRIKKSSFTVGRALTCDLILHDSFISHKHFTINKRSQGRGLQFTIFCHSKNKIYINSNQIPESKSKILKDNDQIWIVNRNIVGKCRTIGYMLKTESFSQSDIILQKYNRALVSLQKFTTQVRLMLKCIRCTQIMMNPVNLQPCCHKVCQNCAIWIIENLIDRCAVSGCNKKIMSLMQDKYLSNIVRAYNTYKQVDQKIPISCFSQSPFLMQKWINYNLNKNKPRSNSQRSKNISAQKEQSQMHQDIQTFYPPPYSKQNRQLSRIDQNRVKERSLQSSNQHKNQQAQAWSKLFDILERIQIKKSLEGEQGILKNLQINPQTKLSITPSKIVCYNCSKTIPFSLKNIQNKQCKICLHQFCNIEFPPCKDLQQPLKYFSQRLIIQSKQNVLSWIQQRLRTLIQSIFLANIKKTSQVSSVLKYVLCKYNGLFLYVYQQEQMTKIIPLKMSSCICDECWPSIAGQMLLYFLKINQNKLKVFCRKNIEQIIAEMSDKKL